MYFLKKRFRQKIKETVSFIWLFLSEKICRPTETPRMRGPLYSYGTQIFDINKYATFHACMQYSVQICNVLCKYAVFCALSNMSRGLGRARAVIQLLGEKHTNIKDIEKLQNYTTFRALWPFFTKITYFRPRRAYCIVLLTLSHVLFWTTSEGRDYYW